MKKKEYDQKFEESNALTAEEGGAQVQGDREAKKSKAVMLFGLLMIIFAVIGLITSLVTVGRWTNHLVSRKALKEELAQVVYPLVIADVPAFDSVQKLDQRVINTAGIWKFLLNRPEEDKYETDDFGVISVPAVDVDVYIREVFGEEVALKHENFYDTQVGFSYDEDTSYYSIPSSPQFLPYSPKILSVVRQQDQYLVEVAYIPPGPFWDVTLYQEADEYNKTMLYTCEKKDGAFYVVSVEYIPEDTPSEPDDTSLEYIESMPEEEDSDIYEPPAVSSEESEDTKSEESKDDKDSDSSDDKNTEEKESAKDEE